jgi:arylsulfatase A-like enzyme
MDRRLLAVFVAGLVVSLSACNRIETRETGPPRPTPTGPSVLLVTVDTLRADRVGAYGAGDARTPTLDKLARQGVRFQTAIAVTPITLPSHASILTGLYPPRHGVRHNGIYRLEAGIETLAERLRAAGYSTAAVVGAYVLARRFGLDQGFDLYDDRMSSKRALAGGYLERTAGAVTDRALQWLDATSRPFFLWVHYYDPHAEYAPPPPFAARFPDRPYQGEIAYVDSELGRLIDALRASGRLEDTLVVVTSDHGESLGEHGEAFHSYTLYDATLAVPLILRGPGIPAGRAVGGVVSGVDVAPTVLALLGVAALREADGRDLSLLWQTGADPPSGAAYAETLATEIDHGWSPLFAIRSPRHHYVRAPRPELYAVRDDPSELRNLLEGASEPASPVATDLARRIDAVLERERRREPEALDAKTRERLAALGYAIPAQPAPRTGLDPKDGLSWMSHYDEAHRAVEAHQLERARKLLEEMLEAVPSSALAHSFLARVHVLEGRPDRALGPAAEAVRLRPDFAEDLALLGDVKAHLGDRAGAEAAYRAAALRDSEDPQVQVGLMWAEVF